MPILDALFYTIVLAIAIFLLNDSGGGKRNRMSAGSFV